jgi:hypothetical protein
MNAQSARYDTHSAQKALTGQVQLILFLSATPRRKGAKFVDYFVNFVTFVVSSTLRLSAFA